MPAKRVTLAKLTRPRLHAALKRARLFKLLDRRRRHPIVWVSGPPGSGKTTLLATYLEAHKAKAYWYQVDEGDRDPASFFHYLDELARQSPSRKKNPLPVLTADHLLDLPGFTRRFFRELFLRLGSDAMLVLDNCQDAAGDTFHLILREACEELPQSTCLVALSRARLPDELARHAANQRVLNIAWDALQLTPDETRTIAKSNHERASTLHAQCDGWVAGLVLLLANNSATQGPTPTSLQSKEALFAYFAGEVFARATPSAQEVLMRTALFPYTTIPMALEINENNIAGEILNDLYAKHYFVERRAEGELTYQYHDLFRAFLLARLQASRAPEQLIALRERAAGILAAKGRWPDAVEQYQLANNWLEVRSLILGHAEELLDQGRWQTLNQWFQGMPETLVAEDPWLLLWRSRCVETLQDVPGYLERALELFGTKGDEPGQLRAISELLIAPFLLGTSFANFDGYLPVVESNFERPGSELDTSTAYLTIVLFRGGGSTSLAERAWRSVAASASAEMLSRSLQLFATTMLIHSALWLAKPEIGEGALARITRWLEQDELDPSARYFAIKDWGYWWFFDADYARALPLYERAADIARNTNLGSQRTVANCYRAMTLSMLGETKAAQEALEEARTAPLSGGVLPRAYLGWASGVVAARSDLRAALIHAQSSVAAARETGFSLLEAICLLLLIRYAIDLGEFSEAAANLRRLQALKRGSVWGFLDAITPAIETELHLRNNREVEARRALALMPKEARAPRKAAWLNWVAAWLPRQLAIALETGTEPETARELIRRFHVQAYSQGDSQWPWPVRIRAFSDFEIEVDGAPIVSKGKAQHKLLELLQILIALGAEQVSVAEICEWVWPDADGDTAAGNLRTSLHRLRKLLRHDAALLMHNNMVTLNRKVCWLDTQAFEQLSTSVDGKATPTALEQAIDLYRGHLFEKQSPAWVLPLRDRLRHRFQRATLRLGQLCEANGEAQKAEALYQQCLERDPSAEPIARQLMLHLHAHNRDAEALAVYRRCEAALWRSTAQKPARETRAVYESLLEQRA